MFKWIWVKEEVGVLVAIVLDRVVSLVANAVWEVVSYAIAVADVSLLTERFDLFELRIFVQDHHRCTQRNGIKQESDYPSSNAKSHLSGQMLLLVSQLEEVIVMLQMCLKAGYSAVRILTAANVSPHLFKLNIIKTEYLKFNYIFRFPSYFFSHVI